MRRTLTRDPSSDLDAFDLSDVSEEESVQIERAEEGCLSVLYVLLCVPCVHKQVCVWSPVSPYFRVCTVHTADSRTNTARLCSQRPELFNLILHNVCLRCCLI